MPKPRYQRKEDVALKVKQYAAIGTDVHDIAKVLHMNHATLRRHYRAELDNGKIDGVASVAGKLWTKAMNGNIVAMIFYLKCQGHWREIQRIENTYPNGLPLQKFEGKIGPDEAMKGYLEMIGAKPPE